MTGQSGLQRPPSFRMSTNRLYYQVKPYLPWGLRMKLRQLLARRQRKSSQAIWPINESAGQRPIGWSGWPEGKQFAFVLTHDVEGPAGLAKCRQLMQLDKDLGFRSCFNFIPEGDYAVSRELRGELIQNGFEVGVHDLHHDGKLYQSQSNFSENAKWINHYLKEWGATGFRSGFMLRNLDWLHELNIQYDTSTFDTDPFEPQPDGAGTIFPFWVRRKDSEQGYIELPYTLAQDSTLFVVLRESTPAIWLQKLDWIARHGGMALVNVHPDYIQFPGEPASAGTYPVDHYCRLLEYVRKYHVGKYWQPLAHELAGFVSESRLRRHNGHIKQLCSHEARREYDPVLLASAGTVNGSATAVASPVCAASGPDPIAECCDQVLLETADFQDAGAGKPSRLQGRRMAVLLFSHYPSDPRPKRAAEALAKEGAEVDFLCLKGNPMEAKRETVDGLNIFRFTLKRRRGSKLAYLYQYGLFISAAFLFLAWRSLRRRYDLVHVHNMPDVLVFAAFIPKLLGAKVVLDLHDPMPELMTTIFKLPEHNLAVRCLRHTERWSIWFADSVLTPNIAFKNLFVSRSCLAEKIEIVMNSPNEKIFQFRPVSSVATSQRNADEPFEILYHGSLVYRHGLDLAIDALALVRKTVPNATITICGENTQYFEEVMKSLDDHGLQSAVNYLGMLNQRQIVEAIQKCDLGVIPNRRSVFTEINMPTRIFEYLALAKPVVAPRTRGIQDYFAEDNILFFEPDNTVDLAEKMLLAFRQPAEMAALVRRGQAVYLQNRWSKEQERLVTSVIGLVSGRPPGKSDLDSKGNLATVEKR